MVQQRTVNPNKMELVLFTNEKTEPLKLFGTELTLSSEVKYLRVIMENKLN